MGNKEDKASKSLSGPGDTQLRCRYYSTMKHQRVYPLDVEVYNAKQKTNAGVVVVRPIIPGAQVSPTEQRLDASKVGNTASFNVTPLAKGKLGKAHVEVHAPGRKVQTLPLGMRAGTQCWSWTLLACAFLIPAFLHAITVGSWKVEPLTERLDPNLSASVTPAELPQVLQPQLQPVVWRKVPQRPGIDGEPADPQNDIHLVAFQGGGQGRPVGNAPNAQPGDVPPGEGLRTERLEEQPLQSNTYEKEDRVEKEVELWMNKNVGEKPVLTKPWEKLPGVLGKHSITEGVAYLSKQGYKYLHIGVSQEKAHLIVGAVFLVLAFLSWSFKRSHRTRVKRELTLAPLSTGDRGNPEVLSPLS